MSLRPEIQRLVEAARLLAHWGVTQDEAHPTAERRLQDALAAFDAAESERAKWPEVRVAVAVGERGDILGCRDRNPYINDRAAIEAVSYFKTTAFGAIYTLRVPPLVVPVEEE